MTKRSYPSGIAAALAIAAMTISGCSGDPAAPEGELPAEQVRAIVSSFTEMGVWAAPGDFGVGGGSASFECTGGGTVSVSGDGTAADSTAVALSFVLALRECGLVGGGLAFILSGSAAGSGISLVTPPTDPDESAEVKGTYRIEGEFTWSLAARLGACTVLLDVATVSASDGVSQARSVDGTLCGLPVGNFP